MASAAVAPAATVPPSFLDMLFSGTWFGATPLTAAQKHTAPPAKPHAPTPVRSPLPHQLGYAAHAPQPDAHDGAGAQAKPQPNFRFRLDNAPDGTRTSIRATGTAFNIDAGKGGKPVAGSTPSENFASGIFHSNTQVLPDTIEMQLAEQQAREPAKPVIAKPAAAKPKAPAGNSAQTPAADPDQIAWDTDGGELKLMGGLLGVALGIGKALVHTVEGLAYAGYEVGLGIPEAIEENNGGKPAEWLPNANRVLIPLDDKILKAADYVGDAYEGNVHPLTDFKNWVGNGWEQDVATPWENGDPITAGENVGETGFDVVTTFIGGVGVAGKIGKLARFLRAADTITDLNDINELSEIKNTPPPPEEPPVETPPPPVETPPPVEAPPVEPPPVEEQPPVKPRRSLPEWVNKKLKEGDDFNKAQAHRYPYNEVHLDKPSGKGYLRLDSYNPRLGEIVSRKATQFSKIKAKTSISYIKELSSKYRVGSTIAKVPSSGDLAGATLRGQYILEVPVQVDPIPTAVLNAAKKAGVTIRDIEGRVYK